jgi:hypothetical protein
MFSREIFLLIAFGLTTVAASGCVTTDISYTTIESDSIQSYLEDPSSETMPTRAGDTITITTKEKISISSRKIDWVQMIVGDVNATRIRGEAIIAYGDLRPGEEDLAGKTVEVKFEDIKKIKVAAVKTKLDPVATGEILDNSLGILLWSGILLSLLF